MGGKQIMVSRMYCTSKTCPNKHISQPRRFAFCSICGSPLAPKPKKERIRTELTGQKRGVHCGNKECSLFNIDKVRVVNEKYCVSCGMVLIEGWYKDQKVQLPPMKKEPFYVVNQKISPFYEPHALSEDINEYLPGDQY